MSPSSSERGANVALPDGIGIRFIGSTESETGRQHLIRKQYANADGRLLVLYRHTTALGTPEDGEVPRNV